MRSPRPVVALVTALLLAAGAPAAATPAVPSVEGPDVPAASAPGVTVTAFTDEPFTCTESGRTKSVSVPAGDWDRIVLVFSSRPDGDPWDRVFGVAIGGVEVLRGTTPRTAFTVRKDVTEFSRLLPAGGTAAVTLYFGTYVGTILGSVTLELYDDEPTSALVRQPAQPVASVAYRSLTGHRAKLSAPVTFPDPAPASASMELTLSGHGQAGEFWYMSGLPPRFHVLVDGVEVATAVSAPYVYALAGFGNDNANTPCAGPGTSEFGDTVHPVMWWTAHQALDVAGVHTGNGEIPPYRAEIAPSDLALLSGARTVEVVQEGGRDGGRWITSLSFLLRN
ncbi:MAG TPA: peptide-N4-asparagine amidase [Actinomycetota bacterium]|nr:peptide-N4-asparagine amidase [Actinomycetota bacterium]